jgi:hypothetical protein
MNVRYRVELSQAERGELGALLSGGKHGARKLKRAQILLAADAGVGDEEMQRDDEAEALRLMAEVRRPPDAAPA